MTMLEETGNIIVTEQCTTTGSFLAYTCSEQNNIVQIVPQSPFVRSLKAFVSFFYEAFLPNGFPDSVSEDYIEYQIWDTLQAFCSTITGAFTTRAILKGVGVGDATATPLSAAVTWILKEGTGMIGKIFFAWWKGNGLDADCKKWRMFADILNDVAMIIELTLPIFSKHSMLILCCTSAMKSLVGVAGGATRASITHHQAIKDNMAEISAKDGSQETLVNLLASVLSVFLLNTFSGRSDWVLVLMLIVLHLYANFLAVKALVFKNFNCQRLLIVLKTYFTIGTGLNPRKVNEKEAILLGQGIDIRDLCGFDIKVAHSIRNVLKLYKAAELKQMLSIYKKKYFLLLDTNQKIVYISLERGETTKDVIESYFHAVCFAIATSIYNYEELNIYSKRQLHHITPITRLHTFMKSYEKFTPDFIPLSHIDLRNLNKFVEDEFKMFYIALEVNGWKTDSHSIDIGDWRSEWKSQDKKVL